jgi:type I restriction enzyme, S subunit
VSIEELGNLRLPDSWVRTTLGELGRIVSGGTPSTNLARNFDGDIPWITPADLSRYTAKYISRGRRNISQEGLENSSATLIPKGSVLFSSRAPVGYVVIAAIPLTTNQGFKNLVLTSSMSSDYVYYYLKANKKLVVVAFT